MQHDNLETDELPVVKLNVPVLCILKSAQQQHGLRHGDYQRYRQYISNKVRRMRKVLDFRQGNRSKVVPKVLTSLMITDSRFITLRIFEIERCWAYAMQLKEESQEDPRKKFHVRNKLRKACKLSLTISQFLSELSNFEPATKLELQAYVSWINSSLAFEIKDWIGAKKELESAHSIYIGLSNTSEDDFRELYVSRADELVPQIRYCAYNIGDESAGSDLRKMHSKSPEDDQLDKLLDQARTKDAEKVTEVMWMNQKIPVKVEQARLAVLSMQESDSELNTIKDPEALVAFYESLLKNFVSAISTLRDEMRNLESIQTAAMSSATGDLSKMLANKRSTPKSTVPFSSERMCRMQLLITYLQYTKLELMVKRSLCQIYLALNNSKTRNPSSVKNDLIGTNEYLKPQELARLYDTIVQNLNEIQSTQAIVQEFSEFEEILGAEIVSFKSFRCYYLALAHGQNKKFAECLALLKRSSSHASAALEQISNLKANKIIWQKLPFKEDKIPGQTFDDLTKQLKLLVQHVEAEDLLFKAQRLLFLAGLNKPIDESIQIVNDKPMIENLDLFLTSKELEKKIVQSSTRQPLIDFPPPYVPLPVKTTFFDLALNHIEYPSYQERVRKTVEQQLNTQSVSATSEQKGGISGFVKGWIWGAPK